MTTIEKIRAEMDLLDEHPPFYNALQTALTALGMCTDKEHSSCSHLVAHDAIEKIAQDLGVE